MGSGEAIRIPIEKLYIPLTTTLADDTPDRKAGVRLMATGPEPRAMPRIRLEEALKHRLLVIVGDPGSGKTTFLRHLALLMCKRLLGEDETAGEKDLGGPVGKVFPMRIAIATLWRHIEEAHKRGSGPTTLEASGWLAHYLATQCGDAEIDLKEDFFRARLSSDSAIVLLDGLDEAPSDQDRKRLVKLIEDAARVYGKCRFVVTSRPAAYVGDALLPGFVQVRINDLEDEAIDLFLKRWCEELYPESPKDAKDHHAELLSALRSRPEIRRLARNPVMLTALAVIHWHEKRLPEQRADLYESILEWLAKSRPRPGRQSPERCIGLLQNLALAMQDHPKGRQVQVPRYWAAREIAPAWREAPDEDRAGLAEQFLKDEELDSGIVVGRGDDTRFWHLTFQEYLAGRALAARDERRREFLSRAQLYQPAWREVILLLAGVLYHQGPERVDGMVSAILDWLDSRLDSKQALGEQARSVGLLGAIVRDLAPVRYQPGDERYKQALNAVLGIFDAEKALFIDFNVRLEAAEALGQAGDPRLGKDNWIPIPAGKFWMGAQKEYPSKPNHDTDAYEDELPVHKVSLDAYKIGRYPVTVEEYRRFIDDEGYSHERWWKDGGFGENSQPENWDDQVLHLNRPVVSVSWYEATAYCAWAGVRLPTEAEWERAARGTNGRKYPWGNEEPDATRANYYAGKVGHPTPVGLYPRGATPEGIEDLAGNVGEWVADRYGTIFYGESPDKNPKDTRSVDRRFDRRVLRGGAWGYSPWYLRAASRSSYEPFFRLQFFGFRCVREVFA